MQEQSMEAENEDNFKVAPLISDDKLQQLKYKTICTLVGLRLQSSENLKVEIEQNPKSQSSRNCISFLRVLLYILLPLVTIIPSFAIKQISLHILAVLIPAIANPLIILLADLRRPKHWYKYIALAVFGYLWSLHFCIARQLLQQKVTSVGPYLLIVLISCISVFTSCSTISLTPVQQFSASTPYYEYSQPSVHSTLCMRFIIAIPALIFEAALFYSSPMSDLKRAPYLLPILTITSFVFLTWTLGWLSSFYNTVMFLIDRIMNGLIFGENYSTLGHNIRSASIWWTPLVVMLANWIAIAIVQIVLCSGIWTDEVEIVQAQHVFLVCLATIMSMAISAVVYFRYRCGGLTSLIRRSVWSHRQHSSEKICFSLSPMLVLTILAELSIPIIVSLLVVFVFTRFYIDESTFKTEKLSLSILLAIDVGAYFLCMAFKQITRVRSKLLGCQLFSLCSANPSTSFELNRDFLIRGALRITSSLAVMAIVLRIQDIDGFIWYILSYTPLTPTIESVPYTFVKSIVMPILIYRSYKRCQYFSHSLHIALLISFILILIDSTSYLYESIFIVLAMPLFPDNPFPALLFSPFTIPKKLVHKNENWYRIGYLLVNIGTFFVYLLTLGVFDFTSIFGLPLYWCVIPSTNCSANFINDSDENEGNMARSTPQHSLYQKIVSELPLEVFKYKNPGYYLLRVSKYILLVEVSVDFYGLFEILTMAGLQTQEVTTCHAKQGETIDKIAEEAWGSPDKQSSRCAKCCYLQEVVSVIVHPENLAGNISITAENEIKLTGIIESEEFYNIFKKCLITSLVYILNGRGPLTEKETVQAEELIGDLHLVCSKEKCETIFPYTFVSNHQAHFNKQFKYPNIETTQTGKKKLPPIKKKTNVKNETSRDDFLDLIEGNHSSNQLRLEEAKKDQKDSMADENLEKIAVDQSSAAKLTLQSSLKQKFTESECHMAIVLSFYSGILGKVNYLNVEKLFKILKNDKEALEQISFSNGISYASEAVGCALKIAVGKVLEGESEVSLEDFTNYFENQYFGVLESKGFSQAMSRNKKDIWTVNYIYSEKLLMVKRLAKLSTPMYMFSFDNLLVKAVWNNLRYELLYAANDNDERYSIQTHQNLLRNLLVESCEEPFGYAGFYSDEIVNL